MPLASTWIGPAVLAVFCIAYALVFAEEKLHLRKSKPVMIAAGLIWILVAIAFHLEGRPQEVGIQLRIVLLDYAELFLFLLSAMSFVNTMVERDVFEVLRARLTALRLSARGVYWTVGTIAFFLSPLADNLTTALVMGTVAIA
ncbi:MAG: sodium:proton antiporter NhaD, partial [Acidobacteriota bacterium]